MVTTNQARPPTGIGRRQLGAELTSLNLWVVSTFWLQEAAGPSSRNRLQTLVRGAARASEGVGLMAYMRRQRSDAERCTMSNPDCGALASCKHQ